MSWEARVFSLSGGPKEEPETRSSPPPPPGPGPWGLALALVRLVGEAFPLPWPSSRTAGSFLASGSWRGLTAGNLEEASRIPG